MQSANNIILDTNAAVCLGRTGKISLEKVEILFPRENPEIVTEMKGKKKACSYVLLHTFPDGRRVLLPYFRYRMAAKALDY